ncbi:putative toxin-antitoxin system toxin component, PIN family [Variovorax rhizosphaerae]|uniref:Toxin-antitoxin system toxin component, PIN family n=1 Tax=Variovorax rhizosphaerae TaxID=1836200 RepID=A0ABU8WFH3_9BURK
MRFVIDTNLIVSGVISPGLPRQLLDAARAGEFELCISEALLVELQRVLGRTKFADRLAGRTPESITADLRLLAIVVTPASVPRVVPTDPDDDQVLAAALAGAADLIASGDRRDLLPLASYEGIPIVSAREAWDRLSLQT